MLRSRILDEIGRRHKTDKGSDGHDYLRKYEFFLRPLRRHSFTLLELGVYKGASLRTWVDYFPEARVVGVDIEPQALKQAGGRAEVLIGDLSDSGFVRSLASLEARVIIDDASHWWPDQLRALFILFPALPSGGLYIVEDIHSSFEPLQDMFRAGLQQPPFRVLTQIAEYITGNDKPAPIVRQRNLEPLQRAEIFEQEIRFLADQTDAVVLIERACLLIKK